jgi:uncharacterized protein YdcH (DUF465 family)
MAETASGVSASYVDSAVRNAMSSLRSELKGEINAARNELHQEIQRLEREMREVGEMIAREIQKQTSQLSDRIENQTNKIEHQTVAVVGGVAATTVMLERTKLQLEDDFTKTRTKLDLQTEASLQIEVGKKISDSVSTHGKLMAFAKDIKNRFEKSIEGFYLNRQLYNVNFKKIFDEYTFKLRTIGEHIFFVRDNDISPAIKAAEAPLEEIHGLPIEVDLYRLKVRAENLDEVLQILKDSRFDKVLNSLNSLEDTLEGQFGIDVIGEATENTTLSTVVIATSSPIATDILVGRSAKSVSDGQSVNLDSVNPELAVFESKKAQDYLLETVANKVRRDPTPEEMGALLKAAASLVQKKLISEEGVALFEDFIGSGNLKIVR